MTNATLYYVDLQELERQQQRAEVFRFLLGTAVVVLICVLLAVFR